MSFGTLGVIGGGGIPANVVLAPGILVPLNSTISHVKASDTSLPHRDTFTRAGEAWAFLSDNESNLALTAYAENAPRLTAGRGWWVEGERINQTFNNVLAGAESGFDAAPTGFFFGFSTGTNVAQQSSAFTSAIALRQSGTDQRPYITQTRTLVEATFAQSLIVEAIDAASTDLAFSPFWQAVQGVWGAGRRLWGASANVTLTAQQTRFGLGALANATGDVTFSLPQIELGTFPSTPIVNTSTTLTKTRSAETWTTPAIGNTFSIKIAGRTAIRPTAKQVILQLDDGTADNRLTVFKNASNELIMELYNAGVEETSMLIDVLTNEEDFSLYVAVEPTQIGFKLNNDASVASGAVTTPAFSTLRTGHDLSGNHWFSTIRERFLGDIVP